MIESANYVYKKTENDDVTVDTEDHCGQSANDICTEVGIQRNKTMIREWISLNRNVWSQKITGTSIAQVHTVTLYPQDHEEKKSRERSSSQ